VARRIHLQTDLTQPMSDFSAGNNDRGCGIGRWKAADVRTFHWTSGGERQYDTMAKSNKPSKMSVDAMEPNGIGQFGISTEIDSTTRRLNGQGTAKPIAMLAVGRQPLPGHGKRYNGLPSTLGRVEAPEEPRVYGNAEDARSTKRCKIHKSLACRTNHPHGRMALEGCPMLGYQTVHILSIFKMKTKRGTSGCSSIPAGIFSLHNWQQQYETARLLHSVTGHT
jgi:hypothetical protein